MREVDKDGWEERSGWRRRRSIREGREVTGEETGGEERISLEALCSRCPDTFLQRGLVRQEKRHVSRHHVHTSSLRGHRYETRFLRLFLRSSCLYLTFIRFYIVVHLRYLPSSRSLSFSLASSSSSSRLSRRRYQHTASQETHEDITLTSLVATRRCLSATAVN